jgi:type I restriction enzyme S subunit
MSSLPEGWTQATVKDLAGTEGLFVDGDWVESKDQDVDGSIRLLQLADIGDGSFLDKSDRWINEGAFERLRCTELATGDVLIARMPDPLGRACLMPALALRCVTVVDVAALRVDQRIASNRWVMHTVNAPQLRSEINVQASGTTRKRISRGNLGNLTFPLPPISEQQRIADKLDTVLTRVDAVNTRLARVAPILKRFRQSVLAAATSGRLTEDWRGTAPADYPVKLMSEVADMRLGKMLDKAKNVGVSVRYLRNVNVRWFEFDLSDIQELRVEEHERVGLSIVDGDLLICEGGEPGRCAVWRGGPTDLVFQKALHRVRVSNRLALPTWISYVLKDLSDSGRLSTFFTGSTIKHLTGTALARVPIPVPTIEEQTEIVRRVETFFAFADRLEARLQAAQTAADHLTPALLAKAFRGELVPQDPNDEPASELLRRLAASRAESSAKPRKRRQDQPA